MQLSTSITSGQKARSQEFCIITKHRTIGSKGRVGSDPRERRADLTGALRRIRFGQHLLLNAAVNLRPLARATPSGFGLSAARLSSGLSVTESNTFPDRDPDGRGPRNRLLMSIIGSYLGACTRPARAVRQTFRMVYVYSVPGRTAQPVE
jgi:hypothetical protein